MEMELFTMKKVLTPSKMGIMFLYFHLEPPPFMNHIALRRGDSVGEVAATLSA